MFKKIKEKVLGLFGNKKAIKKGSFRRLNEVEILDMLGKETCYSLPVFANSEKIGEIFVPTNTKKDNAINFTYQHKAICSKLTHLVTRSDGTIKKSTFGFVPGERLDIFIEPNSEEEVLSQDNFDKCLRNIFEEKNDNVVKDLKEQEMNKKKIVQTMNKLLESANLLFEEKDSSETKNKIGVKK